MNFNIWKIESFSLSIYKIFYFFKSLNNTINGNISNLPNNIPILKTTFEKSLKIEKFDTSKHNPVLAKVENTAFNVTSNENPSKLTNNKISIINNA